MTDVNEKVTQTQETPDGGVQPTIQKETEAPQTQPQATKQPETSQQATLSDKQLSSLKETITQDVSGKVSDEVSKSVIQRIGDALGLTKKQEEALPTDAKQLEQAIEKKVQERFEALKGEIDEEEQSSETERQTRVNTIVQGWYSQYNQLSRMGKVPSIKEAKEGDAGYDARKNLILAIGKMIEQNQSQGIDYTPTIADVLLANPKVLEGPPGADFPISGNTQVRDTGKSYSYDEVHNKSFDEIAEGV